ncbi:unnamed protein product [Lasius platythorax]|uniref:Uncharacterized protein n=1 Tax=Lasius platythorax TaxID=488582 RepID=A0AAV2PA92_9HYME
MCVSRTSRKPHSRPLRFALAIYRRSRERFSKPTDMPVAHRQLRAYSVDRCIIPRHCNTIVSLMPEALLLHRACFRLEHSSGAIKDEILIEFHRDERIGQTRMKRANVEAMSLKRAILLVHESIGRLLGQQVQRHYEAA